MPITVRSILLLIAFIVFCLAAYPVPSKRNLTAAGLAIWVLAQLVP